MYQQETQLCYICNTHSPFLQECFNFLELQIQKKPLSFSLNILIKLFTGYLLIAKVELNCEKIYLVKRNMSGNGF